MHHNSGPTRPYGTSELLVEASFADLRHGGDGDLSKAHTLVEKVRKLFLKRDGTLAIHIFT